MRHAVHGDVFLFHRLEQRRLRLARRAVDLVGEQQIRHHRAGLIGELPGILVVHRKADDVRGHRIGGELHARGLEPERFGKGHGKRRFADAGHVLQKDMALRENGHQHAADDVVLADDNFLYFCLDLSGQFVHALFSFFFRHMTTITTTATAAAARQSITVSHGVPAGAFSGAVSTAVCGTAVISYSRPASLRSFQSAVNASMTCSVAMKSPRSSSGVWA